MESAVVGNAWRDGCSEDCSSINGGNNCSSDCSSNIDGGNDYGSDDCSSNINGGNDYSSSIAAGSTTADENLVLSTGVVSAAAEQTVRDDDAGGDDAMRGENDEGSFVDNDEGNFVDAMRGENDEGNFVDAMRGESDEGNFVKDDMDDEGDESNVVNNADESNVVNSDDATSGDGFGRRIRRRWQKRKAAPGPFWHGAGDEVAADTSAADEFKQVRAVCSAEQQACKVSTREQREASLPMPREGGQGGPAEGEHCPEDGVVIDSTEAARQAARLGLGWSKVMVLKPGLAGCWGLARTSPRQEFHDEFHDERGGFISTRRSGNAILNTPVGQEKAREGRVRGGR